MNQLAILGPGLLGGSLALAVRARAPQCRIAVWARREAAVAEARRICDLASTDLADAVRGADVVVLCVPIGAMAELAERIAPLVEPGALVTDVGSVKAPVVEALAPLFERAGRGRFVGSHPMAGSEQAGLSAAHADLFEGSVALLTPHPGADPAAVEAAAALWRLVGCKIHSLSPAEHDEAIGLVSHLPHLIAASLVNFVCAQDPRAADFCGNGLRDTTRIASGLPEMWTEILATNRAVLGGQLQAFIARLQEISRDLASGNDSLLKTFLTNAKVRRDRHIQRRS
ncbi:MAG: prephenate dehydrogenase/arogenate dehydrogenase family protein [Chthoniobacteraceae bacterium]|nr:prephenate dehydrogenase/arogenate dehydrogenase family protein [Chthoniobacteraceae bacterium]